MSLWTALLSLIAPAAAPMANDAAPSAQPKAPPEPFRIDRAVTQASIPAERVVDPFALVREFMPPLASKPGSRLAMDETPFAETSQWASQALFSLGASEREHFVGYPTLSVLALKPEYRSPVEIVAEDSTSQWIELQSSGEDKNKAKKVAELTKDLVAFNVQAVLRQALEHDGFFGRSHIYADLGSTDDAVELAKPIVDGSGAVVSSKVGKGKLKGFRTVEPVWVWPQAYNSLDPLHVDWYRPNVWTAMSRTIHASRLYTIVARPVTDLLKPAFMFGGLSMTQMIRPVVENWLRTRKDVGDAINNFSTNVLATNMADVLNLAGDSSTLIKRVELYNQLRTNRGVFLIDKEAEDFRNVAMPLAGLSALQGQSQEHMCSLTRIPVIRLLGIQPAGLNSTSEGEITIYKQSIGSNQERVVRPVLTWMLNLLQINRYGEIDPDIVFIFKPLESMTALEKATLEKTRAETATIHIDNRTISRKEERQRIAADPDTPYDALDVDAEIPMEPEQAASVAASGGDAIVKAFEQALVDRASALKGLKALGEKTGIGPEIDDAMITEAENEPPPPVEGSPEEVKAEAAMIKAKDPAASAPAAEDASGWYRKPHPAPDDPQVEVFQPPGYLEPE